MDFIKPIWYLDPQLNYFLERLYPTEISDSETIVFGVRYIC